MCACVRACVYVCMHVYMSVCMHLHLCAGNTVQTSELKSRPTPELTTISPFLKCPHMTVILTDSLSTLQALTAPDADATAEELQNSSACSVASNKSSCSGYQHTLTSFLGSDLVDDFAKAGNNLQQPLMALTNKQAKTLLKHQASSDWEH